MRAVIDILLATWNGERFLEQQIDSILAQTFEDWRLLVRDDGSTDESTAIIRGYVSRYPGRILMIEDEERGLGAAGNFAALMVHSRAPYIMLCDQDDVWLPHKAKRMLAAIRDLEAESPAGVPLLVFSDLTVVDRDLNTIHPSFWRYMLADPVSGSSVNRLMAQNVVTGCASIFNRRLVELTLPIPAEALMHDWWMAQVAAAVGRLKPLAEATVLYRQHGTNVIGAKKLGIATIACRVATNPFEAVRRIKNAFLSTQAQAGALFQQMGDRMEAQARCTVKQYAELSEKGFVSRRLTAIRMGFLPKGLWRKFIFLAFI